MTTKTFNFNNAQGWKDGKEQDKAKVIQHGDVDTEGCPNCHGKDVTHTGKLYQKDRVYKCNKCNHFFASATTYANCDNEYVVRVKGGIIARDLVGNDCFTCPIPKKEGFDVKKLVENGKVCPYFKGVMKFDKDEKYSSYHL